MILKKLVIAGSLLSAFVLFSSSAMAVGSGLPGGAFSMDPEDEKEYVAEEGPLEPLEGEGGEKAPQPAPRSTGEGRRSARSPLPPPNPFQGKAGLILGGVAVVLAGLGVYVVFSMKRGRREQVAEDRDFEEELTREKTVVYRRRDGSER